MLHVLKIKPASIIQLQLKYKLKSLHLPVRIKPRNGLLIFRPACWSFIFAVLTTTEHGTQSGLCDGLPQHFRECTIFCCSYSGCIPQRFCKYHSYYHIHFLMSIILRCIAIIIKTLVTCTNNNNCALQSQVLKAILKQEALLLQRNHVMCYVH